MKKRVLVVDVAPDVAAGLKWAIQPHAAVTLASSFADARTQLAARSWDLVVTNLRLGAYNGLHLVYLAAAAQPKARAIVYATQDDVALAGDVRALGAFFELRERLVHTLSRYVHSVLPPRDRREAARPDRRKTFRGGRRAADVRPAGADTQRG